MKLATSQKKLMERVLNAFETGSAAGNYAAMALFNDGPNNIKQITFGRSQTTEFGNLKALVQKYIDLGGTYGKDMKQYLPKIGVNQLAGDTKFKDLLVKSAKNDAKMKSAQDLFFDEKYFKPAMKWADANGFILPLSGLVIYDSFIHSGGIFDTIRNMFPTAPPVNGGNEIDWTTEYVNARKIWLANHPKEILHTTIYRMTCFQKEIARGNWMLSMVPIVANGVGVS